MKRNEDIQGTVVYKCNHLEDTVNIIDRLAESNHCAYFSINSLFREYLLIEEGVNILVMQFNTEAG